MERGRVIWGGVVWYGVGVMECGGTGWGGVELDGMAWWGTV